MDGLDSPQSDSLTSLSCPLPLCHSLNMRNYCCAAGAISFGCSGLRFSTCQCIKERGKRDGYLTFVISTACIVLMCRNTSKLYRAITISLVLFTPAKTAGNLTRGHVHHSIHFLWSLLMNFSTGEFRSRPGHVLTGALPRFLSLKENCPKLALSWGSCCVLKALAGPEACSFFTMDPLCLKMAFRR